MCLAGKKIKITLAKSRLMCYYHWAENEIYPGVAKFGIALEWGSRGRWFESSHSDQISRRPKWGGGIFLFNKLDSKGRRVRKQSGGLFSRRPGPPAGGRIQSLGPRKNL